jgi:hypothetical protein
VRSSLRECSSPAAWRVLAPILGLSACLNLSNLGFPFAFHADEPIKIDFIQHSTQNFNHPLLMLQLVRSANLVLGLTNAQAIAVLGRAIVGLCATMTVLLSYLLARRSMSVRHSAVVAAAVAVAPTLVVHAHYLKEDTILTTCLMAAMLCYFQFRERPSTRSALSLGIATGMAFSAHYKAILLVPLYFFPAPPGGWLPARRWLLPVVGGVAAVVFLAINWPLVFNPQTFLTGVLFEADHAQIGHDVPIWWMDYWLGFHLIHSLVPGLGVLATVLGLAGLVWACAQRGSSSFEDRWLVAFVLVFYLVPEISPLKPWPDFSRYMLPVVPPLLYFAWKGVVALSARRFVARAWPAAAGFAALVLLPAYMSVRLLSGLTDDTRGRALEWLREHPGTQVFEAYSSEGVSVRSLTELDPAAWRAKGVDYLVASSFMYDRYLTGARLRNQRPEIYWTSDRYARLFRLPYVEFAPAYRTFAFSNPVIRIIDLRQSAPSSR